MKILILADPIPQLQPASDTTLAFLRRFMEAGQQCYWACSQDVFWEATQTQVQARMIQSAGSESLLPQESSPSFFHLETFDIILVRKEPPFDEAYMRLCWFLAPYEKKIAFFNRPSALLRHHEKMIPLEAVRDGVLMPHEIIPTFISEDFEAAARFASGLSGDKVVLKPWRGHGGRDVQLISKKNFSVEAKQIFEKSQQVWMLQGFLEKIYQSGDRRVLFLSDKCIGDFVRIPKDGSFVSNLAQGGSAKLLEMSAAEKSIVTRLGAWLKEKQIDFAGADFIDEKLSEVNITCPTGVQMWKSLTGKDVSIEVCDFMFSSAGKNKE